MEVESRNLYSRKARKNQRYNRQDRKVPSCGIDCYLNNTGKQQTQINAGLVLSPYNVLRMGGFSEDME